MKVSSFEKEFTVDGEGNKFMVVLVEFLFEPSQSLSDGLDDYIFDVVFPTTVAPDQVIDVRK